MRRVLMIAFHYPPAKVSSGIQRALKFSTYLPQFGWEPLVLTAVPRAYERTSNDQMGEIPAGMVVKRAACWDSGRHFAVKGRYLGWTAEPDRWVSWWPGAVLAGLAMVRKYKPDAIYSTYPIASAHLIGMTLKRLTGVSWVADLRDSMTEPGYPVNPRTWRIHRRIEQAVVKHCDKALFTAPGTLSMYSDRYPDIDASRWQVIENGFDEENFTAAEADFDPPPRQENAPLHLVHSGVLYPRERDPGPFFRAIARLKKDGEVSAENLRVTLRATGSDDMYAAMLRELGIDDIIRLEKIVPYKLALQEMLGADGLLIFQGSVCNHQIPAKLYEYFRAGRPIYAVADPQGDTVRTLQAAGMDEVGRIDQEEHIAATFRDFTRRLRQGGSTGVSRQAADSHTRLQKTRELAAVLDEIGQRPRRSSRPA
jgi:glycosyltransferase involved in cell wall biosynthesis